MFFLLPQAYFTTPTRPALSWLYFRLQRAAVTLLKEFDIFLIVVWRLRSINVTFQILGQHAHR
jgi:hypothetical protein